MARVSVIVPTRNGARFIGDTIASIARQSFPPDEIVLVDDGSTDDSVARACAASALVRVVATPGLGPAGARNAGIRAATGDLLGFLDHDDLWVPEKLAWQLDLLAREPAIDVVVGQLRSFRDGGDWLGGPVPGYLTITMLARRSAFDRVGLLDQGRPFSDSAEWFLRAADAGVDVRMLDRVLTHHRVHESNHSLLNAEASRAEFLGLARARLRRTDPARTSGGSTVRCG